MAGEALGLTQNSGAPAAFAYLQLVLCAAICGGLSMGLYRLAAPRKRLAEAKRRVLETRRVLAAYDGPADGLSPRAAAAVGAALRHLGLNLGPALLAALPVAACFFWLDRTLPVREYVFCGPAWLRTWETPFWSVVAVVSLAVKRLSEKRAGPP